MVKGGDHAYYQEYATAGHLEGCSLLFGLLFWLVFIGSSIADVANQRILLEEFLVPCVRVNLRFSRKNENGRHKHTNISNALSKASPLVAGN